MSNHFHILLEVPPMPAGGISDEELLKRLSAIYTEAYATQVPTQKVKKVTARWESSLGLLASCLIEVVPEARN